MRIFALLALIAAAGCTRYEYEEEVFLEVDGSGQIRMSGSSAAIEALHEIDGADVRHATSLLEGEGIEIVSARETEREGRTFVHVEARFSGWERLCRTRAFRDRACRLDDEGKAGLALELFLPSPRNAFPDGLERDAVLALRYHFPSTVHHHNSPGGIERGNIVAWKRTLREHFAGRPLDVEARFDRRTILETAVSVFGLSLALVVASIAAALVFLVRKGRRQLRADAIAEYPSRSARLGGG